MAENKPSTVKIYYEKGNHFRVAHVDGAIGGLTPTRDVFISLWNQRTALPKMVEQTITPDGKLGPIVSISADSKQGIFREMEIGIVMTPEVADQIAAFLLQHARAAKESIPKERQNLEKIQ